MPAKRRIDRMVRHFKENGLRVLLEAPGNVRDLLELLQVHLRQRIDFDQMRVSPTRFVQRDFRHREADIVLVAPLRSSPGRRRRITIYIFIEHQSEPDVFMVFRVLEYVVLIYKKQQRDWLKKHESLEGFRFQPVLPIVLYSGSRPWPELGGLAELVEEGTELGALVPAFEPLFLNLGKTTGPELEGKAGKFGWLLRVMQEREAGAREFKELLLRVLEQVRQLAEPERGRWLDLLSYLAAFVYNERAEAEHAALLQDIEDSAQTDEQRREIQAMKRTAAQALMEQGAEQATRKAAVEVRQQMMLRLLRKKFGKIPAAVVKRIEATNDVSQLESWFDEAVTANALDDLTILAE